MDLNHRKQRSPILHQLYVNFALAFASITIGFTCGFQTILHPQLQEEDSDIRPDLNMATWIASVHGICNAPAVLFIPALMQYQGRKIAFICYLLPALIGWIVTYTATNARSLLIASALEGLSQGGHLTVIPVVIAEYNAPTHRGVYLVAKTGLFYGGVWIVNVLGTFLHWRTVSLLATIPIIIAIGLASVLPDTPNWLAGQGHFDRCTKSFRWLRGHSDDADKELRILMQVQSERRLQNEAVIDRRGFCEKFSKCWEEFLTKVKANDFWKPVSVYIILLTLHMVSGKFVLMTYAIQVLTTVTKSNSTAYTGMMVFDGVTCCGLVASCVLVKHFKRKTVLLGTTGMGVLFLVLTSICLYLQKVDVLSKTSWLSLLFLLGFIIATSLGTITLPVSLSGEILPLHHKGFGSALGVIYYAIINTVVIKVSPYLFVLIEIYGTLLVFAFLSSICLVLIYKYMPETKDRTLQEIEDYYTFGKFVDRDCMAEEKQAMLKSVN